MGAPVLYQDSRGIGQGRVGDNFGMEDAGEGYLEIHTPGIYAPTDFSIVATRISNTLTTELTERFSIEFILEEGE